MALATYSDTYKDVYGIRPHNMGELTTEELSDMTVALFSQLPMVEEEYLTDDEIAEKERKLEAEALASLPPHPTSMAMGDAMRIAFKEAECVLLS